MRNAFDTEAFYQGWCCHGQACSLRSLTGCAGPQPNAAFNSQVLLGFPSQKHTARWETCSMQEAARLTHCRRMSKGKCVNAHLYLRKGGEGACGWWERAAKGQNVFGESERKGSAEGSCVDANEAAKGNCLIARYKHTGVYVWWRVSVPQQKYTGREVGKKKIYKHLSFVKEEHLRFAPEVPMSLEVPPQSHPTFYTSHNSCTDFSHDSFRGRKVWIIVM